MGIVGKILGNASISDTTSANFEKLLLDDEEVLRVYKFIRDEIIITNKGFYHTDVKGVGVTKREVAVQVVARFPKSHFVLSSIPLHIEHRLPRVLEVVLGARVVAIIGVEPALRRGVGPRAEAKVPSVWSEGVCWGVIGRMMCWWWWWR